ncbi:MAG: galactose-1-phosphate uridylyltransferase [Bacteroidia bacterium]|nr:galactose-1-phosphate uridylyltransferase [Bacteroidia bacterium]MDW8333951.1 galactose-1-phosphate uridylyltransferase [Bacteroidia bacterium]
MNVLRYNPLLGTWTIVAAGRQTRPNLPKDYCPFCPRDNPKLPLDFEVLAYDNDFPALHPHAPEPEPVPMPFLRQAARGKCEVVLYSPEHDKHLKDFSLEHVQKIVGLWRARTRALFAKPEIKYVHVFENRGEAVGVTIHHPHGQIYAYPFLPLKIQTELDNARQYFSRTGTNLFDALNAAEIDDGRRILLENASFVAYLPDFTDYPFGAFVVAKKDLQTFVEFSEWHAKDLAQILRDLVGGFDFLYRAPFPYMMCVHQAPPHGEHREYFRFHIEFYPPLRAPGVIKYYASSELGAWAAANTRLVEETAQELRAAIAEYRDAKRK